MVNLSFEAFSSIIESIRLQTTKDREHAEKLSAALNIDSCNVSLYDNSLLVKSLLSILHLQFPKKDSFCEIEHYMFDLNFGKVNEQDLITVEDLWFQLNNKPMVSTHPLIDEQEESYKNTLP